MGTIKELRAEIFQLKNALRVAIRQIEKLEASKTLEPVKVLAHANVSVHDTAGAEQLAPMKPFLKGSWCNCGNPEFLVYSGDNCCPCGVGKHHVHCKNCGSISQVG